VVVVTGAAGATGSVAAQLAKVAGARVIGVAGGQRKIDYLRDTLGLDGAIDYKSSEATVADSSTSSAQMASTLCSTPWAARL
jgi:hypothetical protein